MHKILLVEDNEMNRDMLSRRLKKRGFHILLAIDGEKAVEMAHNETPDLILMDMELPVLDGWEATKRLRQSQETCNIPIIGLSAHALTGDSTKALEVGCNDYDTKPVEIPRLLNKIYKLLGKDTST